MMSANEPHGVGRLEHDHVHLNRLVDNVRADVQSCLRGDLGAAELKQQLREFVDVAQDELLEHFDVEESGLFPYIGEVFPDQATVIEKLELAHDRMCGVLSRLDRATESDLPSFEAQLDTIIAFFARFDANFVQHARDEAELLRAIASRLTPEQRKEVDRLLAEI